MKISYKKILTWLFNAAVVLLVLIAFNHIAHRIMNCDVTIQTEYPFCNGMYNYTIERADFYTINYLITNYHNENMTYDVEVNNCGFNLSFRQRYKSEIK